MFLYPESWIQLKFFPWESYTNTSVQSRWPPISLSSHQPWGQEQECQHSIYIFTAMCYLLNKAKCARWSPNFCPSNPSTNFVSTYFPVLNPFVVERAVPVSCTKDYIKHSGKIFWKNTVHCNQALGLDLFMHALPQLSIFTSFQSVCNNIRLEI